MNAVLILLIGGYTFWQTLDVSAAFLASIGAGVVILGIKHTRKF